MNTDVSSVFFYKEVCCMRLALAQMSYGGSIEINFNKSIQMIREAATNGADLLLFPEVQLTEFFCQYPKQDVSHYGLTIDSWMIQKFQSECKRNHIMAIPNVYLKEDGHYYDASILIGNEGSIIGIQKMVHVAYAHKFYESDYYTPSNDGFKVFESEFGKLGIVVCYDRHYPESIRTEALMGADLILIPTVNTEQEPMELFEQEIRVQAFQNDVYIAMANRVGKEDEMHFSGQSIVVDPQGNTILKADNKERIVYVDIENFLDTKHKKYMSLRKTEFYI